MLVDLLVTAPHALTMAGDGVGYRSDVALAIDWGGSVDLGRTRLDIDLFRLRRFAAPC